MIKNLHNKKILINNPSNYLLKLLKIQINWKKMKNIKLLIILLKL